MLDIEKEQDRLLEEFRKKSRELEDEYSNQLMSLVDDKFVIVKETGKTLCNYDIYIPDSFAGNFLSSTFYDLQIRLYVADSVSGWGAVINIDSNASQSSYLERSHLTRQDQHVELSFIDRTLPSLREFLYNIAHEDYMYNIFSLLSMGRTDILDGGSDGFPNVCITSGHYLDEQERNKQTHVISLASSARDISKEAYNNPYYLIDIIVEKAGKVLERLAKNKIEG